MSPTVLRARGFRLYFFMKHQSLAEQYRAADIAVWPTQESMSVLDAASSGLPIIVYNAVGEVARVNGNGRMYQENDVNSMVDVLGSLVSPADRQALSAVGRRKMLDGFNWKSYAQSVEADYDDSLKRPRAKGHFNA